MDNIKVFGHGPSHGQVTIEDSGYVLYQVDNLPSQEMIEARILFPISFVPDSSRMVAQDKYGEIMREELNWAKAANVVIILLFLHFY